MFDELLREMKKLSQPRTISISVPLDEKGYYDRECPGPECGAQFKVLFEDWKDKVRDEQVFCPFCRHEAKATEWHTPEQAEHIKSVAMAEMTRLVQGAMKRGVERSRPMQMGGGFLKLSMSLSYRPGSIPPVLIASATEAMRQDFTCETCGCRYASIGASFFCPACGHNSALSSYQTTVDTVEKTVLNLPQLEASITAVTDADTAANTTRQILEDQYGRLVGAFERVNEALFERLVNASQFPRKGNVFQRLDDASGLWFAATGKQYTDFISSAELDRMKLHFQRRHVFSHKQGLVDQAYLDKSADSSYAVGQRLVAKSADVLDLIAVLKKLVAGLQTLS